MASPPPQLRLRRRSPPALMEELIEEILLRLPPDEPARLVRAALVCRAWRSTVSNAAFLRRYREFHATPPLLGYLCDTLARPRLVSTSTTRVPFFSKPAPSSTSVLSWVTDCRHGRVLIDYAIEALSWFVIWDPVTGRTKHLVAPSYYASSFNAAVLCAVDGCDHLSCHDGPSRVVFVQMRFVDRQPIAQATMYSSATNAWSTTAASVAVHDSVSIGTRPNLLIGDALYFTISFTTLKYDLGRHALSMIETPGVPRDATAIRAEHGGLGFVTVSRNCIHLISSRQQAADGSANIGTADAAAGGGGGWVRHRAIKLGELLPKSHARSSQPRVVGYVEGTDTVLLSAYPKVFTLDLKSRLVRKLSTHKGSFVKAYTSFYTPGIILLYYFAEA
ncbi:hypothetical protein BS78_02G018700 [Paspalum vaginatum]|nr:hypothetical protein BS78_02G018700 [Paspalum vaginatum]